LRSFPFTANGGNSGDGVKIAGEVIGSGDGIDENTGRKDENTGGIILSLEFFEELKELLLAESDEAEK
ncbi:hypothetical protein Tco_0509853, partial [Tanacetum coccineum]